HMLAKLKLCVGSQHPHQAQSPISLEPVSGRPTASGVIYTPEPKPRTRRPKPEQTTGGKSGKLGAASAGSSATGSSKAKPRRPAAETPAADEASGNAGEHGEA